MADDNAKSDKYEAQLSQAVEYLRGNVKWSLLAFGAIGTTLLAGSQLSSLGKFDVHEPRLWAAVMFAILALGAASYAVRSAQAVAYTGHVEYSQLTDADFSYVANNKPILEGFDSVAALRQIYEACIAKRYHDLLTPGTDAAVLESNEKWYAYLDSMHDKVLAYIRYNRIRLQVDRSRAQLTGASLVAAIGLLGFAWAANPEKATPTIVVSAPVSEARIELTEAGQKALAPLLGEACVKLLNLPVLTLSVTEKGSDVLTVKSKDCAIGRFTLTEAVGRFIAAAPKF